MVSLCCPAVRDGCRGCPEGRPRAQGCRHAAPGCPSTFRGAWGRPSGDAHQGHPAGAELEGPAGHPWVLGCTQPCMARRQTSAGNAYLLGESGQALVVASGDWGRLGPCLAAWKPRGVRGASRGRGRAGPGPRWVLHGNTARPLPFSALRPRGGVTRSLTFSSDAPGHTVCPVDCSPLYFNLSALPGAGDPQAASHHPSPLLLPMAPRLWVCPG